MAGSRGTDGRTLAEDRDIESLLGALEDTDCRAIIEATSDEARSAGELSEACDLPLSTTYRKLDQLTDVGVLEEEVRISKSGQHENEYSLQVDRISLSLDAEGVSLEISHEQSHQAGHSAIAGAD